MLPAMSELMPPFLPNYFVWRDFIYSPGVAVRFVKEYGLEDVAIVGNGCGFGVVIESELMLVICAAGQGLD